MALREQLPTTAPAQLPAPPAPPEGPKPLISVRHLRKVYRVGICFRPVLLALSPRSKSGYFSTI